MEIGLILMWRYRDADPNDWAVQDDGEGPYIVHWDETKLGPQPTNDQLRSWWLDAEKFSKKRGLAPIAEAEYLGLFADDGIVSQLDRDEINNKKVLRDAGRNPQMNAQETAAADRMQLLRDKWRAKRIEVNQIEKGPNETVEQAVQRVRDVTW